jgi:hypothetical protein
MRAAAGPGVVAIGAGNYGGKLGKFHFHLRPLLERYAYTSTSGVPACPRG